MSSSAKRSTSREAKKSEPNDAGTERQRHPHGRARADAREPLRLRAALAELFVGVVDDVGSRFRSRARSDSLS
jgi:hypothetical protein